MTFNRLTKPVDSINRIDWLIFAGIFIVALTSRLTFLSCSSDKSWPHSVYYEGDAPEWVQYAAALNDGKAAQFEFGLPMRAPATAYLLHLTHWLAGDSSDVYLHYKEIWCFISALTCALAYVAFRQQFPRSVSLLAAGLCVFSFAFDVVATSLNSEPLYTFILMLIVISWQHLMRKPILLMAMATGALHGLATLIRPEHTLLLLVLLVWGVWVFWRRHQISWTRTLMLTGAVGVTSLVVCLPWSISKSIAIHRFNTVTTEAPHFERSQVPWTLEAQARINTLPAFARNSNFMFIDAVMAANHKQPVTPNDVDQFFLDQFRYIPEPLPDRVLVTLKGPFDFALANHPKTQGEFSKAAMIGPMDHTDPALMIARPDHLRLINHGYAIGWSFITQDFSTWLRNVGAKLAHYSDGITLGFTSWNFPLGHQGVRRPIDAISAASFHAMVWKFLILAMLAAGIISAVSRKMGAIWFLIIAYKIIIAIFFYGYARQAISILPAFYLFIALSIDEIARHLPPMRWIGTRTAITTLVIILGVDLLGSLRSPRMIPPDMRLTWSTPELGIGAFRSFHTLELMPVSKADAPNLPAKATP